MSQPVDGSGVGDVVVGVIGLGYVGLPLAAEFGKKYEVVGFDISEPRVAELNGGFDRTGEVSSSELASATGLRFTSNREPLRACTFYIVTVPTPVNSHKQPDLAPLIAASETVGSVLKPKDVVVYESTVYPGATEEVCVPVLERASGLRCNVDFGVGYSPERINPGDKEHRLTRIVKVTSASSEETAKRVDHVYASIIPAGTYRVSSIKVAETAKVIENTQRDLNIALVNELALICHRLGVDTHEVLEAAGTKWNFLKFRPGLVGGHCIGVDPYYLTHKAQALGYHPEVILAGRRINDGMGAYVAEQVIKLMTRKRLHVVDSKVLILGLTFKEDCADVRNSKVIDIVRELQKYHASVDVFDPCANAEEVQREYGLSLTAAIGGEAYDAIILAVAHKEFRELDEERIRALCKKTSVVYDVKGVLPLAVVDARL